MGNKNLLEVWNQHSVKFPLLFKLAKALMVMPYSSCFIERIFSKIVDIKTLKRNRLGIQGLEACLLIKQEFGDDGLEISPEMLAKYNKSNSINSKLLEIEPDSKADLQKNLLSLPDQNIPNADQTLFFPNPFSDSQITLDTLNQFTKSIHSAYLFDLLANGVNISEYCIPKESTLKRIPTENLKPENTKMVKKVPESQIESLSQSQEPIERRNQTHISFE